MHALNRQEITLFANSQWASFSFAIAVAALLGGCSDPVKDAKDRLAIVEKGGSSADICRAQRAVAEAQLQAKNEAEYPLAKLTADIACNHAKLDALSGSGNAGMVADNMEAEAETTGPAIAPSAKTNTSAKAATSARTGIDPEDPNDLVSRVADGTLDMCYKDYCPCEGEQGGPDTPLCDQLEQGIQPPVDLMIAGRAMREGRRQLEASGY